MSKQENWSVTLTPHRSLSRQGFLAVMTVFAVLNLIAGSVFYAIGAWPVLGFLGLDVILIWWAFTRNFADAARAEQITASGEVVTLSRFDLDGTKEDMVFNRRWVRIHIEFDEFREMSGRLYLRSHGTSHEIASFLGAEERQSLAKVLRSAL